MRPDKTDIPDSLRRLSLSQSELEYFSSGGGDLPFRITDHWFSLIGNDLDDPLRKQAIPRINELDTADFESDDPIGDEMNSPQKGLIHHYEDRALILVTDRCALYCRHCFRRHHTGQRGHLSLDQLEGILSYIESHTEIHEVLLSGGDALMAPLELLERILEGLDSMGRPLVVRLGTRLPVVDPLKVSDQMVDLLEKYPSLWLVTQVNHSREISPLFLKVVRRLQKRGIAILNQSVLLKGVNDSVEALKELNYKLIENRIKPYYLFQGDLARGTSHFRVSLDKALTIYRELSAQVSHVALPRFALDLPLGGGKVNLEEGSFVNKDDHFYYFKNTEGLVGRYPIERKQ